MSIPLVTFFFFGGGREIQLFDGGKINFVHLHLEVPMRTGGAIKVLHASLSSSAPLMGAKRTCRQERERTHGDEDE